MVRQKLLDRIGGDYGRSATLFRARYRGAMAREGKEEKEEEPARVGEKRRVPRERMSAAPAAAAAAAENIFTRRAKPVKRPSFADLQGKYGNFLAEIVAIQR